MAENGEIVSSLTSELRRGTLVLGVLTLLSKPMYGWSLISQMQEMDIPTEGNTLYPLLRRLEKQGLLKSEWETSGAKPRKYYEITKAGVAVRNELSNEWNATVSSMSTMLRNVDLGKK